MDEMLGDFLDEAGELLQDLGPQLVELEQDPDNPELLNAVFRAFHTVKGGAGFLNLHTVVELCHNAEDVFGLVRNGELAATPEIMDLAQRSLDVLEDQLATIGDGEDAAAAPADLLQALKALLNKPQAEAAPTVEPAAISIETASEDTITEDEFEALLDQLQGSPAPATEASAAAEPAAEATIPPPPPKPAEAQEKPARKKRETAEASVRVDTKRLDTLMNLVGELVLVRNRLKTIKQEQGNPQMERTVSELDTITYALQSAVMRTRMQPIGKLFARFPKLTRDLSRSLNKEIELELIGQEEDLDKNLVEALADPMVHLVRNAMDHGIEAPEIREKRGKPRVGKVRLAAQQEGDSILIHIEDDGAGMDAEVLREKAIEKGLMGPETAANMSNEECYQIIFMPGFSTKAQVSEVSGRGVGMDVVKSRINELNGQIHITSELGHGSCITLRLPLTLAILPTLMTRVHGRAFAVPLSAVEEVFLLKPDQLRLVEGRQVVWMRGSALPLISLRQWVDAAAGEAFSGHVIVAQIAGDRFGLVVDDVTGREEVVIKPLGQLLQDAAGIAGATVTGHGGIALILDLAEIAAQTLPHYGPAFEGAA
ncbi:MAG: chemotaxis protein CheA [Nevskiales bacterium]